MAVANRNPPEENTRLPSLKQAAAEFGAPLFAAEFTRHNGADQEDLMPSNTDRPDPAKLDQIVASARGAAEARATGYRERALKIYPWICGRCAREFNRANLRELTVHHRDHNHDNNPPDGSNWELLCLYCHDNEHARQLEQSMHGSASSGGESASPATHKPFAELLERMKGKS